MTTFRYKIFGIGKLPPDLRAGAEQDGLVGLYEGVPAHFRFAGRVPGLVTAGTTRTYSGAVALTRRRLLCTLSVIPGKAGRAIDAAWDQPATAPIPGAEQMPCGGPVQVALREDGVHLRLDVASVGPEYQGELVIHFELRFSPQDLAALPRRELGFGVPKAYVQKLVGVPS